MGPDTTVVLYGGNNSWFADYWYWFLTYRDFDNIKMLDGGLLKWRLEDRPMTTEVPSCESTGGMIDGADRPQFRALRDEVLESSEIPHTWMSDRQRSSQARNWRPTISPKSKRT